ncbi:MAG: hypothetical protein ACRELG_02910, partial [Gemmataceae bacterium]
RRPARANRIATSGRPDALNIVDPLSVDKHLPYPTIRLRTVAAASTALRRSGSAPASNRSGARLRRG